MARGMEAFGQGVGIGSQLSAPFQRAFEQKRAREQALEDQDAETQLRLQLLAAQHPELGIQAVSSQYDKELGSRVANPAALGAEQQTAQQAVPEGTAFGGGVKPLVPGFATNPKLVEQAKARELSDLGAKLRLQASMNPREVSPDASLAIPEFDEKGGIKSYKSVFTGAPKGQKETPLEFKDIGTSIIGLHPTTGKEVSRIAKEPGAQYKPSPGGLVKITTDEDGNEVESIVEKTQPVKTGGNGMTAGQKITAQKEVRSVYDELPAKVDYFGKGQVRGSAGLKSDLDAILTPTKDKSGNPDFNKLSPQALSAFVFRMNKSNDPTSATLLAEAQQIANKTGFGDRVSTTISKFTSGKDVSPAVAQDIYNIISQVESAHKERLINSVMPLKQDLDDLGKPLTAIGVPKEIQDEIERRTGGGESRKITPEIANEFKKRAGGNIEQAKKLAREAGYQ